MKGKHILIGAAAIAGISVVLLNSCSSRTIPEGATAVKPFDVKRYTGKWYEIARLDFKYEKGLNNTTADYRVNEDGAISVINRGYDVKKGKWKEVLGKAKFLDKTSEARLKVSFFGPFYSGYNVIAIDPEYQYALVAGESLKYLWLLSRDTVMPENVKREYLSKAKELGYNIDALVWVQHGSN
jgi:apolipoprotein D and lipocalin family protein